MLEDVFYVVMIFPLLLRSNCQPYDPVFKRNLVEPRRIELLTS